MKMLRIFLVQQKIYHTKTHLQISLMNIFLFDQKKNFNTILTLYTILRNSGEFKKTSIVTYVSRSSDYKNVPFIKNIAAANEKMDQIYKNINAHKILISHYECCESIIQNHFLNGSFNLKTEGS